MAALDVKLSAEEISTLNILSAPPLSFVTTYREAGRMFHHGGINVNGVTPPVLPLTKNMIPGKY